MWIRALVVLALLAAVSVPVNFFGGEPVFAALNLVVLVATVTVFLWVGRPRRRN